MARCGGCLSAGAGAGAERDRQALKGDVTAERIGILLGCEGKRPSVPSFEGEIECDE